MTRTLFSASWLSSTCLKFRLNIIVVEIQFEIMRITKRSGIQCVIFFDLQKIRCFEMEIIKDSVLYRRWLSVLVQEQVCKDFVPACLAAFEFD